LAAGIIIINTMREDNFNDETINKNSSSKRNLSETHISKPHPIFDDEEISLIAPSLKKNPV
jgi:hypothetical protein